MKNVVNPKTPTSALYSCVDPVKTVKDAVTKYYENINLEGKSFSFESVSHASVLKPLQQINPSESTGIDNLTGKFLKEGAPVLASPITDLVNLLI